MAFHAMRRPASVKARLRKIEDELIVIESYASIESRAQLTRWLVGCDEAAELYDDYVYLRDELGTVGVLQSAAGRAAILAMVESLYSFEGLEQGLTWPGGGLVDMRGYDG